MTETPLRLFNSLTRQLEDFKPFHEGEARVYTCGPTVYNYPHIGNMRAYVFADTLGRVLSFKGYKLTHVINITDVGHLTDDGDAGEDKLEKAAVGSAQSIWDIAKHYTEAYWDDVKALNIREPAHWSIATDYIPAMIDYAKGIEDMHCYELEGGLYFDVSTVENYGWLAREEELLAPLRLFSKKLREGNDWREYQSSVQNFLVGVRRIHAAGATTKTARLIDLMAPLECADQETFSSQFPMISSEIGASLNSNRINEVEGKRNAADFAIWRKTPAGETRQMEWESPWGKGAPGWHLECSVMSEALLGLPFDIHTGGIDHREIHHVNEIAQNQAHSGCDHSGARIWMHNNFLIDRSGKMSKSSGEFLRLQLLIDKGFHPLAYRLMCLQAHYRSELEFSWDNLAAAFTRLKRIAKVVGKLKSWPDLDYHLIAQAWNQNREDMVAELHPNMAECLREFEAAFSDDLNTSKALVVFERTIGAIGEAKPAFSTNFLGVTFDMDRVLGLNLLTLTRQDLRIRPISAQITEGEIEAALTQRKDARAAKDFATSDRIRDDLIAQGVEVMDGDPLGWDWRISL
jgi:cysteinyl-tRNA synthetase